MRRWRVAVRPLVVPWVALLAAFSWGAAVHVAYANHYHTNCIGHGFVHGDDSNDGSFFSRVETGCGSVNRRCDLHSYGLYVGGISVYSSATTCNAWSRNYGNYVECASSAHVFADIWSDHFHYAHNWCG